MKQTNKIKNRKNILSRLRYLVSCLFCWLSSHDYFVEAKFSDEVRKVGCHRCGKFWGMNDRVKAFVVWDEELEQFHTDGLIR